MTDLTDQARANLEAGSTDGPGTDVCRGCAGPKEPTRLNSSRCRACGKGRSATPVAPTPTRTLRTDLPTDVWERFAAEAAERGVPIGRHLRDLIVARDTRKHGATPVAPARTEGD